MALLIWVTLRRPAMISSKIRDRLAPQPRDSLGALQRLERLYGRLDHVVGVRGAERLRHDVVDPGHLRHGAHRTARDDAGPGRRGLHEDASGAEPSHHGVGDGRFAHGHGDEVLLRVLDTLANRLRDFRRLAETGADTSGSVTDDNNDAETEAASAHDHLGHAVDGHHLFFELRLVAIAVGPTVVASCHAI